MKARARAVERDSTLFTVVAIILMAVAVSMILRAVDRIITVERLRAACSGEVKWDAEDEDWTCVVGTDP